MRAIRRCQLIAWNVWDPLLDTGEEVIRTLGMLLTGADFWELLSRWGVDGPEAVKLIARGAVSFDPANPRRVVIER